jgi:type I restriction enzyme, S subunit
MNTTNLQSSRKMKRTSIGEIPVEWSVSKLDHIATIQTGIAKGKTGIKDPVEMPYLRVANVQDGYLDLREVKSITINRSEINRYILKNSDVILTEGGDLDKLGRGCLWEAPIDPCLHQNHIFVVRTNHDVLLPSYFALQIAGPHGRRYFLGCAKQTTNLASINSTQLRNFPVLVPSIMEQSRIVAVFLLWDKAIERLEKLIAAKKKLKQGLMQQLLEGRRGFEKHSGKQWPMRALNDVFDRVLRPLDSSEPEVLSITARVGFVTQREKFSKVIAGNTLERYIMLRKGEFAYNKGNSKAYPQGCIYRLEDFEKAAVPQVYFCFAAKHSDIDAEFYKYYFQSGLLNGQLASIINTGVRNDGLLNLDSEDFFRIRIHVPPVKEQREISKLFRALDKETTYLQKECEALRLQKKGLMQKLLTGKVRVSHLLTD